MTKMRYDRVRAEDRLRRKSRPAATAIISKYSGTCASCRERFGPGTKIMYDGSTWHVKCWRSLH